MKRTLAAVLLTATTALLAAGAHAQTTSQGLTREQVRADLYRSFLNGTTSADEKTSYPQAPSDRASVAAQRTHEARVDAAYSNFVQ
jgi:hypothetical protein